MADEDLEILDDTDSLLDGGKVVGKGGGGWWPSTWLLAPGRGGGSKPWELM